MSVSNKVALPKLPNAKITHVYGYTAEQMLDYARDALAAERARHTAEVEALRSGLRGPLQEYVYRTQAFAPFEHAEWTQQAGAALMRALVAQEQKR